MITTKEILKNILEMNKNLAPEPDGLILSDLMKIDPNYSQFMTLFNVWLVSGSVPDMVKECRAVLISKWAKPERQRDINNWHPITIGSIILRLFSRIITIRLTKVCPINPRQRGFIKPAGCAENLKLLQLLI